MCGICGCAETGPGGVRVQRPHDHDHAHEHAHAHDHAHPHDHAHAHDHPHDHDHAADNGHARKAAPAVPAGAGRRVSLEVDLLQKNDLLAAQNRGWLAGRGVRAINLVSGPGAGKTTLLEATLRELMPTLSCCVIEGDQETLHDARRIEAVGCPAVQVNTGAGCHLEADMVARGLAQLDPAPGTLVFVENVGNLVCPALFDLGEQARVALVSVTEGEDKPLKYPHIIRSAQLLLLSKVDLLPHLDFDIAQCERWAREVNPEIRIVRISARDGTGMAEWTDWLRGQLAVEVNGEALQAAEVTAPV